MIAIEGDGTINAVQIKNTLPALPDYVNVRGAVIIGIEANSPAIQSKDCRHVGQKPNRFGFVIVGDGGRRGK